MNVFRGLILIIGFWMTVPTFAHPLKLSLCEIEYSSEKELLTINLKLFLTDVNEAIVFNPNSNELKFCQPNESAQANQLLLNYLNQFFYVKVNQKLVDLHIKNKKLKGVSAWVSRVRTR